MDTTADTIIDGRYLVKREIARGGMAIVYEATHMYSKTTVALKVLHADLAGGDVEARLAREAEALTRSRHPNVVTVFDAGQTMDGRPYLVMEMLEGRTLAGLLAARGQLSLDDTVGVARQVGEALAQAHLRGVVHRDVKPTNILVSYADNGLEVVKLIDFGVAKMTRKEGEPTSERKLTVANSLLGTVEYIAPECYGNASAADGRSDVYGLAVTIYECLAGNVPFEGDFSQVMASAVRGSLRSIAATRPEVPAAVDEVLARALAFAPDDRYADVHAFLAALSKASGTRGGATELLGHRKASHVPAANFNTHPASPRGQVATARRKFPRAAYVTPARVKTEGGTISIDGRTEDVSEGGLLVVVDRPVACESGSEVSVRFSSPMSGRVVTVPCIARWTRSARGARALGLEFKELTSEARVEIARYVALMGIEN